MRSHRFEHAEPEVEAIEPSPDGYPGKVTLTAGFRARRERDSVEHPVEKGQPDGKSVADRAGRLAALDDPFGLHLPIQAKGELRGAGTTANQRALPSTSSGVPLPPAVRAMMERAFNAQEPGRNRSDRGPMARAHGPSNRATRRSILRAR